MKLTELLLAELDREANATRRTLEQVPGGHTDWKPHPKSMPMGYLATLCATLPSWIALIVNQDQLDLATAGKPADMPSASSLVAGLDANVAKGRAALEGTNDEYLLTTSWRLLVGGKVVYEDLRHIVLRDTVFNHLAHHRGQLTVYLRLTGAKVPSIYGPSADEGWG